MRYATRVVVDIRTGRMLEWEGVEDYSGPVAEAKKGRETVAGAAQGESNVANQAQGLATSSAGKQNTAQAQAAPFVDSLMSTKPGELSPLASAQYASDVRNIDNTYGNAARTGLRQLAYRGMGSAPTGAESSIINTANQQKGAAETGAYENALQNTQNQGLAGVNYLTGQQQIYDPTRPLAAASGAYGQVGQLGAMQNQMGSTLGDIGQGLAGIAMLGAAA